MPIQSNLYHDQIFQANTDVLENLFAEKLDLIALRKKNEQLFCD